ncbi:MAG TPA: TetR/AcrR family transcriptional regulator [Candidatus Bathyarchaeia archaeon]|nr:TetR/AcrR family transcriptional regulator [Candidatus Bathyarchaeia archaeon]
MSTASKHLRPVARPGRARETAVRRRLSPAERRRHLLRAAASIMTAHGIDGVQFAHVAAAAGVTRPLVYRFFPSRQALIMAVLEDFAAELTERFGRGAMRSIPGTNVEVARVFVEAVCDTIEARGAGPWHLLDSKGPDPEVARLGEEIMDRLLVPWRGRIIEATGASEREAATLARMIVAAGRAVLELWCAGVLTRAEAVRDATRGVSALVEGFTRRRTARRRSARSD